MIISVASGKGGTGKTLVSTSLALVLSDDEPVQFVDCDVEEPNAHLFLHPDWLQTSPVLVPTPTVDEMLCTSCGRCAEVCAYHAIAALPNRILVFPELCHGCGACHLLCPEHAISEMGRQVGVVETGRAGQLAFLRGQLNVGEPLAPAVVKATRRGMTPGIITVIDVGPGTSCSVVAAIRDTDFCLLVTEETPFGLNDLEIAVDLVRLLHIPHGVVINRSDRGHEPLEKFCAENNLPVLLRIPLDMRIAQEYAKGVPLVEALPDWRPRFNELARRVLETASRQSREGTHAP